MDNLQTLKQLPQEVKSSISKFQNEAISSYNNNVSQFTEIVDQEELIKKLYNFRLEAMMTYYKIFKVNPDTFNDSEYWSWFNDAKRELESKIEANENKIVNENVEKSEALCKDILKNEYKNIQAKIDKDYYNQRNCEEYLKDNEKFLSAYNQKAKGPNKIKVLIEFIGETKPEFIKKFTENLDRENKEKLKELNDKLMQSNANKQRAEEEFQNWNDRTQDNSKKTDDWNSNIQKKKEKSPIETKESIN